MMFDPPLAVSCTRSYALPPMLELTQNTQPQYTPPMATARTSFTFVGERLWLDFVNSELSARSSDALHDFESLVQWLEAASLLDGERASGMRRRAVQQPAGAAASLIDARRVAGWRADECPLRAPGRGWMRLRATEPAIRSHAVRRCCARRARC